jgi:hypothetical protein
MFVTDDLTDSDRTGTVPIKLIDSERFRTVFFYAAAAADSRRLTRSVALSALPHAPVRRGPR